MKTFDGSILLKETINVLTIVLIIVNLVVDFFWM